MINDDDKKFYLAGGSSFGKWEMEGPSSRLNRNEVPGIFFSENFLNPSLVFAKTIEPLTVAIIAAPPMVTILLPDLKMKLLQHLVQNTSRNKSTGYVWFDLRLFMFRRIICLPFCNDTFD